jgi:hypothetical protein
MLILLIKSGVWDRHNILTNQDILILWLLKGGLESKTDTRFSYCNTNYAMLALIIEKVTNMSYKSNGKNDFQAIGNETPMYLNTETDKDTAVTSYKE